jgi:hypothetical protein
LSPAAVANYFAPDGHITINRGDRLAGRAAIEGMAAGFYAAVPDMVVRCDGVRTAGDHVLLLWTFEGHHAETHNALSVGGWEEWTLGSDLKVRASLGWFDADEYARQIVEGV